MKVYVGEEGLDKTWQNPFEKETKCVHCGGDSRIGFVGQEKGGSKRSDLVFNLHKNNGGEGGDFWLHDACSVAVYFCKKCLKPTALYNQA